MLAASLCFCLQLTFISRNQIAFQFSFNLYPMLRWNISSNYSNSYQFNRSICACEICAKIREKTQQNMHEFVEMNQLGCCMIVNNLTSLFLLFFFLFSNRKTLRILNADFWTIFCIQIYTNKHHRIAPKAKYSCYVNFSVEMQPYAD